MRRAVTSGEGRRSPPRRGGRGRRGSLGARARRSPSRLRGNPRAGGGLGEALSTGTRDPSARARDLRPRGRDRVGRRGAPADRRRRPDGGARPPPLLLHAARGRGHRKTGRLLPGGRRGHRLSRGGRGVPPRALAAERRVRQLHLLRDRRGPGLPGGIDRGRGRPRDRAPHGRAAGSGPAVPGPRSPQPVLRADVRAAATRAEHAADAAPGRAARLPGFAAGQPPDGRRQDARPRHAPPRGLGGSRRDRGRELAVRTFCDLQGREAGLGRCLGRGGEGAVYSVPMWPGSVAKIYARRPDDDTSRKLAAMVQLGTESLSSFAAWPQNLLLDPKTGGTVGFVMPRVEGHREIHALYGPTDRKAAFPDATWSVLVRAARNVAAAFATVHEHGHVVGDVNQGNVVVSRKATVRLIDCDSFQISHLGHTYPCRVGVPLYTPPELQGLRLEGVVRTQEHDRFGLAVLVFQLLFMGRHPFAGRHPERALPLEAAIKEGLFAFGKDAARLGFEPPPFSRRRREVPARVARLFGTAFGREAAAGEPRPTATEWVGALDELDARIVTCGDDPRHAYAPASGSCPWCRIENEGGPSFFFLAPGTASDAFDLPTTCRAIEAVRSPGPAPALPPASAVPTSDRKSTRLNSSHLGISYAVFC